jgi:hypothetical protein
LQIRFQQRSISLIYRVDIRHSTGQIPDQYGNSDGVLRATYRDAAQSTPALPSMTMSQTSSCSSCDARTEYGWHLRNPGHFLLPEK